MVSVTGVGVYSDDVYVCAVHDSLRETTFFSVTLRQLSSSS